VLVRAMDLPEIPAYRIRPDLRVVCHADDWAFVLTETERRRVAGRLYVAILSELAEPVTEAELARRLAPSHGVDEIRHGIQQLLAAGYVVDSAGAAATRGPARTGARALAPGISLRFLGHPDEDLAIARTLTECGLSIVDGSDLTIVVVEDYLDPRLTGAIDDILATDRACVPFKPYGSIAWLGPVFRRGGDACWGCMLHRVQVNRPVEMYLHGDGRPLESILPRPKHTRATLTAASLFAGCEIVRRLQPRGREPASRGLELAELVTLDIEHMSRQLRPLVRRPQCLRCGDPGWMKEQLENAIVLQSRRKVATSDGGHRIEPAESTHDRLVRHVDSAIGAISNLGAMPSKNHSLRPVFSASHYLRPAAGTATRDERFDQVSVGKGWTVAQARTSALCEALERQCARFQGDEPRVRGSQRELAPLAIDPRELLLFSERQYAQGTPQLARSRLLATPRSQVVPRAFDASQAIDWTPAWSLTQQARKLVPFTYVFAGAPQLEVERVCAWDSNGCAAGNCLEEAILQGIFELVERDATAIWWYNRISRPGIALESFDQPYFLQVREHYAQAGHELWLLDLTHDLGIPVVIALASEMAGERYAAGLGCHLDLGMAVQRALTELHQVFDPEHRHDPLFTRSEIGDESFLRPLQGAPVHTAASHPNPCSDDLRDDLELCSSRLRAAGLELLVVDYSRPDVALTTVKVMVPGLRHFWPRFAPGRLYDVPVRLGWLPRPWVEAELNPMPLLM
jgi:ribosomal protein S12 methylthiotransferase accessory factor